MNIKIIISTTLTMSLFLFFGCSDNNNKRTTGVGDVEQTLYEFKDKSINGNYDAIYLTNIDKKFYLKTISECVLKRDEDKFYEIKNDIMGNGLTLQNDVKTTYDLLSAEIQNDFKIEKNKERFLKIIEKKKLILKNKISENYFNILFNKWTENSSNILEYRQNQDNFLTEKTLIDENMKIITQNCVVSFFNTKDFDVKNIIIPSKEKELAKIEISFFNDRADFKKSKLQAIYINEKWILSLNNKYKNK